MKTYKVIVKPVEETEVGTFQFLSRLNDPDAWGEFEFDDFDNGNEVYELSVSDNIIGYVENQLNLADGVISYEEI